MRLFLPSSLSFKLCIFLNYSLTVSSMYIMHLDHIQPKFVSPVPLPQHFPRFTMGSFKNNPSVQSALVACTEVWGSPPPEHRPPTSNHMLIKMTPLPPQLSPASSSSPGLESHQPSPSSSECSLAWSRAENHSYCGVMSAIGVLYSKVTSQRCSIQRWLLPIFQLLTFFLALLLWRSPNLC